ncbi:unnamed protein product [Linum tenue]|uniref:Uncharacterized protein n=1 Tax=Linum tenue TaxID=586396 RepID=A0AAV0PWP1_9ROSI|nr:unnamed protein product [Linum tenue]
MPSGAKKRKAAKKKKEQQAYHHHPSDSSNGNNPQGNGDQKVEDERDSDISEVNSPGSEGNPHRQHTFDEGNGLPGKTGIAAENPTGEAGRSDEAAHHDDEVIKREEDGKSSNQEVKNREVTLEHMDSEKASHGDRSSTSSSSSSSSSDDESSSAVQDKLKEVVIPISEEVITEMEAAEVVNPEVIEIAEGGLKDHEVKLPTSYQSNEVLVPLDSGKNQEVFPTSDQNVEVVSETVTEGKTLASLGAAAETSIPQGARASTETDVSAVYAKDTKISESIEKQLNEPPGLAAVAYWMHLLVLIGDARHNAR